MLGRINGLEPRARAYPSIQVSSPDTSHAVVCEAEPIEVPTRMLRRFNGLMALFHTILFATTLMAGNTALKVDVFTVTSQIYYRLQNETTWRSERPDGEVEWRLVPGVENDGVLYFTTATAGFFLISAVFHFCNATLWRGFYERQLAQCRSPTRWAEYFVSAPLMFVLIAYGLGLRTRAELLATTALVSATIPYGAWGECVARPASKSEWTAPLLQRAWPWALGHVPQTIAWIIVFERFATLADSAPWFVTVILWSEFLLFYSFGGAVLVGLFNPPSAFWKQEIVFQVLSLVSKGLLGLLLITNVLMLQRFEDAFA